MPKEKCKQEYIKIDPNDIETLINLLNGSLERTKIINYIKEYIYNPDYNYDNQKRKLNR